MTASRSSASSATDASIRAREKSSISRPWTIAQSPPEVVTGLRRMQENNRTQLKKQQKWVQALEEFEQQRKENPGIETERQALARMEKLHRELWPPRLPEAPMPREVKR